MNTPWEYMRKAATGLGAIVLGLALTAGPAAGQSRSAPLLPDPLEPANRVSHQINKGVDRFFLRPISELYEENVPETVKSGILNFNSTWGLPMQAVNSVLQGQIGEAGETVSRFGINASFGLLGFLDVAGEAGLAPNASNFAETLAVWGVAEGIYLELPFFGSGSSRDQFGVLVDTFLDPFAALYPVPPEATTASTVVEVVDVRAAFGPTIDNVLYESTDSYEAFKLVTIQQSRNQAGSNLARTEDNFLDIYAD